MSEAPMPGNRGLSPWWALLLIPVALFGGWLVGQLPSAKPAVKTEAQQSSTTVPTSEVASGAQSPGPSEGGAKDPGWNTPFNQVEKPAGEEQNAEVSQWTSLEVAMAESERNGKPVLIDFNAEWCGPCRAMKEQVFDNFDLGQAVQTAVIPVSIVDRAREEGRNRPEIENLQQRFGVNAFPTLVVFSPQSGKAVRTQGFPGAQQTAAWIAEAARSVR